MTTLTPAQRQDLKGLAHGLEPVVLIGNAGLTAAVLKEIDVSLKAHELIKVKAGGAEREERTVWLTQICEALGAQPVQHIGKILVIYRENTDKPAPEPARRASAGRGKSGTAGKSRPAARANPSPGKPPRSRSKAPARGKPSAREEAPDRVRAPAKPRAKARPGGAKPSRRD